jgi:hypothetical protein
MFSWKRKNRRNKIPKLLFRKKSNWNIIPKSTVKSAEINVRKASQVSQDNQ